ncbi:MAG: O-antigen ligase family protein, partial [Patescibacteria group bacterium]
IISLTLLVIIFTYNNLFSSRIQDNTTTSHNSVSDRMLYKEQASELIQKYKFTGTGTGNYTNTLLKIDTHKNPTWQYQPVHNTFLLITAELGLVGITLFLFFIISIFLNIYEQKKPVHIKLVLFITIFISLLFISLFDHWPWTSHFGLLLFFLSAGLTQKTHYHTT